MTATIRLGLERMGVLLARLAHPERRLPPVVHVAGTNGKGSTIAFMRAIAESAGLSVHAYTSPHWIHERECVRLGCAPGISHLVDELTLGAARHRVQAAAADDGVPTPFETLTLAALLLFAEHPADLLLLETGMGGTLDATNVVDRPAASVITRISRDHTDFLGSEIRDIAAAKAGIIKPGAPVFAAAQDDTVLTVLENAALPLDAPLYRAERDWNTTRTVGGMAYVSGDTALSLPAPALEGTHQIDNAGLAIATLRHLFPDRITDNAIAEGLRTVQWPGRLQRASMSNRTVWVDGGHNDSGGQILAAWAAEQPPLTLVVGMLSNKDVAAFLSPLVPFTRSLIAVPLPYAQRPAYPPDTIAAVAAALGVPRVGMALSVAEALTRSDKTDMVLVCGSLAIVPEVLPVP